VGRTAGAGEHGSGDIFLAFATGNRGLREAEHGDAVSVPVAMYGHAHADELFYASVEATEEAILNAMLAAETMTGRDGITVHRVDPERLPSALDEG
jgi:D-aminopeptidase